jgi:hypothetical protein
MSREGEANRTARHRHQHIRNPHLHAQGSTQPSGWSNEIAVHEASAKIMRVLASAVVLKPDGIVTARNEGSTSKPGKRLMQLI